MPNYYNPYAPNYQNGYSGGTPGYAMPQAGGYSSYSGAQPAYQQNSQSTTMQWVDGEIGARTFPMPAGWPVNQPITLWDSNDTIFYWKSWGPMGMPNPLQAFRYDAMALQSSQMLQSGAAGNYATKEDVESLRSEMQGLREALGNGRRNGTSGAPANNGNPAQGNRGGNNG